MNLISHYWELNLLNISLLKTSNINTGHKSMIVSNKRHNLQNRTVQITGHKKTWIGTIAIRKGLKYKFSSWASLKSKDSTHTIYWLTNWNVEMLEPWKWTFHMTLLKALKLHPASVSEQVRKQLRKFTDSTHIICWLKSSKQLKIIFLFMSVLNTL